jgi:hypothetical protein
MDKMKTNYHHTTDVKELAIDGTTVTSTAAELNILDGVTSTAAELNAMDNAAIVSMTTATTPASGSCAVQLVFKDAAGVTVAVPVSGLLYMSEVATGLTMDAADTSLAVLTNGVLTNLITHSLSHFISTAAGLLGMTITAATDSYWIVIVLPNGKLLISDECVVNA